jgi:hypothetical protein
VDNDNRRPQPPMPHPDPHANALLDRLNARRLEPHRELRGHDFFPPAEELAQVPVLYATDGLSLTEKQIVLHYFAAGCDWWVCEVDPRTGAAFGYVCLGDPYNAEWGYLDLNELCSTLMATTPPVIVERDLSWTPKPASACDLPGRRVG